MWAKQDQENLSHELKRIVIIYFGFLFEFCFWLTSGAKCVELGTKEQVTEGYKQKKDCVPKVSNCAMD